MIMAIIELLQHPAVTVMLIGALFVIGMMCIFVIGACVSCALIEIAEHFERMGVQRSQWFDRLKRWTRGER